MVTTKESLLMVLCITFLMLSTCYYGENVSQSDIGLLQGTPPPKKNCSVLCTEKKKQNFASFVVVLNFHIQKCVTLL
ncbi:hypothetical protein HanXRQr2_Chr17g0819431 [Helianthus annuus]|uniref:Uncharacterized protein n=1 Tax=Helianthus annuus TaxID=4232 RepID=A0A251RVU9_HELAN|nr:hypothetical protein HanXRQr2_Chr17g0819431 [Helianthus annuus]